MRRKITFTATDHEKCCGHDTTSKLLGQQALEFTQANWPAYAWMVEVFTVTITRKGLHNARRYQWLNRHSSVQRSCYT